MGGRAIPNAEAHTAALVSEAPFLQMTKYTKRPSSLGDGFRFLFDMVVEEGALPYQASWIRNMKSDFFKKMNL